MTSLRPFQATDLFDLNPVNLDCLTENFQLQFYLSYLTNWPSLFFKSVAPNEDVEGYMMGKTEGTGKEWHTHITAVTVNPSYRRIGLASQLCQHLQISTEQEQPYNSYFIDLFVRVTNKLAITLYEKLGYSIYRRVIGYYGSGSADRDKPDDGVDAFDMRKSLKRDKFNESVRTDGDKCYVLPHEVAF